MVADGRARHNDPGGAEAAARIRSRAGFADGYFVASDRVRRMIDSYTETLKFSREVKIRRQQRYSVRCSTTSERACTVRLLLMARAPTSGSALDMPMAIVLGSPG